MGFPESLSNKVLCKAQACRQHDGSELWLMRSQAFLCEGEFSCCIVISLSIFLVVLMAMFINFAIPKADFSAPDEMCMPLFGQRHSILCFGRVC